jgi:hypothetical protein
MCDNKSISQRLCNENVLYYEREGIDFSVKKFLSALLAALLLSGALAVAPSAFDAAQASELTGLPVEMFEPAALAIAPQALSAEDQASVDSAVEAANLIFASYAKQLCVLAAQFESKLYGGPNVYLDGKTQADFAAAYNNALKLDELPEYRAYQAFVADPAALEAAFGAATLAADLTALLDAFQAAATKAVKETGISDAAFADLVKEYCTPGYAKFWAAWREMQAIYTLYHTGCQDEKITASAQAEVTRRINAKYKNIKRIDKDCRDGNWADLALIIAGETRVLKAALHKAGIAQYSLWERSDFWHWVFRYLFFGWIWM